MRNLIRWYSMFLGCFVISSMAYAASPWTQETTYGAKLRGKLDFGFKNAFAGWTEIYTEPKEFHDQGKCAIKGFGTGLVNAVADTLGGILHIATFPITNLDVPLPENGVHFE